MGKFVCWLDRLDKCNHNLMEIDVREMTGDKFFQINEIVIEGLTKD